MRYITLVIATLVFGSSAANAQYQEPLTITTIHEEPLVKQPQKAQYTSSKEKERRCIRAENLAKKDFYNKEMKYYQFGRPALDHPHEIRREILKEKYNLEIVMMGCAPVDSFICYNNEVEKIMFRKYGKDFWEQVEKEVDKAANKTDFGSRNGYGRGEEVKPSDR